MKRTIHIKEEVARCLLCEDAPCTKACKHGDPARAIRAIRLAIKRMLGDGWKVALRLTLNKQKMLAYTMTAHCAFVNCLMQ